MTISKTIALAFSMFSAIPVPFIKAEDWSEKNLKYILCAFPLVGLAIAILWHIANHIFLSFTHFSLLRAAVLTALPVLVTGGIHLDGYLDACDAFFSHKSKEDKLLIMKDSHSGAFAIIYCAIYFIIYFSCVFENRNFVGFLPVFIIERLLSALAVATFPNAKTSGLAKTFSDTMAKKKTTAFCIFSIICISILSLILFSLPALIAILAAFANFLIYYIVSKRVFGGITGDLAGAFVEITELFSLFAFTIVSAN